MKNPAGSCLFAVVALVGVTGRPAHVDAENATRVAVEGQVSSGFSEVTGGDQARFREDRQIRDDFSGGWTGSPWMPAKGTGG